ncbi:MAG: phosphoglycolate phosphatase [Hyphomicrobiales bacterium]|nr:phosphoglycolate phosphatase [Hyphomicrobiales bacterium]
MKNVPDAILFDLDGTLIHSAPDLHAAANFVCQKRGLEIFDLETIISFVGNGVPVLVKRIFDARDISLADADIQNAITDYLDYYDQHSTDLTRPYEGVVDALDQIKGEGMLMAVVTNKPEAPARAILEALKLDNFFSTVVGGDTTGSKKPDPAPYFTACNNLGVDPSSTIYVGDSETDGKTADAANVPFILYSGGYRNLSIEEINHWRVIDSFSQLPSTVNLPVFRN